MELDEAASRLRRDLLCANCQRGYTNRKTSGLSVACKFSTYEGDNQWLHCSGCEVDHLSTVFSAEEAKKPCNERLCIGRQGYVRLCKHEVITWADIEARVNQALRESIGGDLRIMTNFRGCQIQNPELGRRLNREICEHHSACMSISKAPMDSKLYVSLRLVWVVDFKRATAETTGDSKPLSAEGMRAMAQALRLGGAASIIPAEGPSHLPEMDCFSASWDCSRFLRWPRVLEEQTTSQPARLPPEDRCVSNHTGTDAPCTGLHTARTISLSTTSGLTIAARGGLPIVSGDRLIFIYKQLIFVSDNKTNIYDNDGVTLTPSHAWYHAMDRSSYSWQGGCGALESCENQSCQNYYNLTAVSPHYSPHLSRKCKCDLESADGEDQEEGYDTE